MDSYLFQYAVGGLVFLIGIAAGWKTGQLGLAGREGRRLLLLVLGLLFFAGLQGALLIWGP